MHFTPWSAAVGRSRARSSKFGKALEEMAKAWTQLALSAGRGVRPEENGSAVYVGKSE